MEHSLALPFFGIRMKSDLFQSCGRCWVSQICWHTECSTLTRSSFRIFNSSARILPPLLALFVVIFPMIHLNSHSSMSGSKQVTKPSWLTWSIRSFLHSSSEYSCHLFLISYASVRSLTVSDLYYAHPCMKCPLYISSFLKEIFK